MIIKRLAECWLSLRKTGVCRLGLLLLVLAIGGCNKKTTAPGATVATNAQVMFWPYVWTGQEWPDRAGSALTNAPICGFEIVKTWSHDRSAFTEGLVFVEGNLIEGTGLNGQSRLQEVELESGKVLKQQQLDPELFGEGVAVLNGKIFQLTWKNNKGFIYDLATFHQEGEFAYEGEGWGLTTDGHSLILSDGTPQIRFLDPNTFVVQRTLVVSCQGRRIQNLNELEYVNGELLANVWGTDYIACIDPITGDLKRLINFSGLFPVQDRDVSMDVFNGIAYDEKGQRLFVTGKLWPKIFEVRVKP